MIIETMKQALEVLDAGPNAYFLMNTGGIANKLRQAIAELEKQEAVGVVGMDVSRPHISYGGQYLGQKPDTKTAMLFKDLEVGTKLYIHPQPKAEKQEPVCAMCRSTHGKWSWMCGSCLLIHDKHPHPKHEWVGLTEQERNDIEDLSEMMIGKPAFDAIEKKLKEKNGYAEE